MIAALGKAALGPIRNKFAHTLFTGFDSLSSIEMRSSGEVSALVPNFAQQSNLATLLGPVLPCGVAIWSPPISLHNTDVVLSLSLGVNQNLSHPTTC